VLQLAVQELLLLLQMKQQQMMKTFCLLPWTFALEACKQQCSWLAPHLLAVEAAVLLELHVAEQQQLNLLQQ
jgi:hypothetical protein